MNIDYYSIGLRIRQARNQRNITQDDLAEMTDLSRPTISLIEGGKKGISLEVLIRICNALEISSDKVLLDELTHSFFNDEGDIPYLLLDCNENEERIITNTMVALKNALRKFRTK